MIQGEQVVADKYIIDGTNVAYWEKKGVVSIIASAQLVIELLKRGAEVCCFFDANTSHLVLEKSLYKDCLKLYDIFKEVPGGIRADDFILLFADNNINTFIISNDQFRDKINEYPWLSSQEGKKRLIKGDIISNQLAIPHLKLFAHINTLENIKIEITDLIEQKAASIINQSYNRDDQPRSENNSKFFNDNKNFVTSKIFEVARQGISTCIQDTNIQRLVEHTAPGCEIILEEGTYTLTEPLKITKPLSIIGLGDKTRILCTGKEFGLAFSGGPFTLKNLAIEHTGDSWANVVHVFNSEFNMTNCRISGGKAHNPKGVGTLVISSLGGCIATGNGMLIIGETSGIVKNNIFENNDNSGIYIIGVKKSNLLVEGNKCSNNKGAGIYNWITNSGTIKGNTCQGNGGTGINYQCDSWNAKDNTWSCKENLCEGNGGDGIYLYAAGPLVEGNICRKNSAHGIDYFRLCGGIAKNNTCENNEGNGIFVGRIQMKLSLKGNFCQGNKSGDVVDERKISWWLTNIFRR